MPMADLWQKHKVLHWRIPDSQHQIGDEQKAIRSPLGDG